MRKFGWLLSVVAIGCGDKEVTDETGGAAVADTSAPVESDGDEEGPLLASDMPEDPGGFTLTLSDGRSLNFDQSSCQHFRGSTNFRAFWRDSARSHTYVLTMQIMQTFEGAGSYASPEHRVEVKLLEEAPRTGAPTYWTDASQGDSASINVAFIDEDVAWGETTVPGMRDAESGAAVSLSPGVLPVWCSDVEI